MIDFDLKKIAKEILKENEEKIDKIIKKELKEKIINLLEKDSQFSL